ncbi:MAG: TspO/MBR family protein [Kofleriaceae bacterium]
MPHTATTTSAARNVLYLAIAIVACQLAGALGALVTEPSFYGELHRPSWAPPAWVFGPVWITLYSMMAVAAWLVWRTGDGRRSAMVWFAIQLALNAAWSPVFFGLRSISGGAVVIVMLDIAIIGTLIAFVRRSRAAAILLVPYAAWVWFATALNVSIWRAN